MKTKRKTWYLQKKDILYVEENHDGMELRGRRDCLRESSLLKMFRE